MRPTLRQLEYLVKVAQLGRFGLAAEALNVSQPSLSAQIAEVEADLGQRLFLRSKAGAVPTAIGAEVVTRAQRILREVEDLRAFVRGGVPFGGRLRLGVLPSIGPYLLPPVVAQLHVDQPELRVILREESTLSLEQGLKSGRFDMIISTPEDHPNSLQHRLFDESLWVAVARDDPLAARTAPVSARDLNARVFLTLDPGHRLSRIVYALASECGGMVSDDYEGTSLDSLRLMAASGAGVAILPELYARRHAGRSDEVAILPLAMAQANRSIALIQPVGTVQPSGTDLVLGGLRSQIARMGLQLPPPRQNARAPHPMPDR
jgi:LysR family hydrogen peroxide-inducible transcriptional activator